jgi:hypothetical protein
VSLKNISSQEITFAQLRIDVIDPQSNRIVAKAAGLTINKMLGSGQELSGKASQATAAELGRSLPNFSIASQRVLVQVDAVEMANGTLWRYGLLHRRDPNDPKTWWPITPIKQRASLDKRSQENAGKATLEKASLRPRAKTFDRCYTGCCRYQNSIDPPMASCPYCTVYDEVWVDIPGSNFGFVGPVT